MVFWGMIIINLQKKSENLSLTELIDFVLEESGLKKELEKEKNLENSIRLENLMEFKSITYAFETDTGSVNIQDFLETISLISDIASHKSDGNEVTLMTLHSAKGLEFPCVFIIGLEEGIFPNYKSFSEPEELEEERRLCYVGITRAKERLYLTNAKRRLLYGQDQINPPSRFIGEISRDLIDTKEQNMPVSEKTFTKDEMYIEGDIFFRIGDIITHDTYGFGVVVDMDDRYITIAFKTGTKKIDKNHKSIKKVENNGY